MVAVRGRVVTGYGKRHHKPPVPFLEFPRLDAREIVLLVFVAVHGEVLKMHPGDTGDGVGVFRRGLRLREYGRDGRRTAPGF